MLPRLPHISLTPPSLRFPLLLRSEKSTNRFNSNSSALTGNVDSLLRQKKLLEEEIKADEDGIADYELTLFRLGKLKKELEGKLKGNEQWIQDFKDNIGPFEKMYQQLVDQIHSLYGDAKEKHAAGLQILYDEFAYHPAYKRWDDQFTATPFKPA